MNSAQMVEQRPPFLVIHRREVFALLSTGGQFGAARVARRRDASGTDFDELLCDRQGVVRTAEALRYLSPAVLRWRLTSGRWQQPCRGVVVAQSGPLSATQQLWAALLWAAWKRYSPD